MLFSIVIPAYNYGQLLRRAVESAVTQSGEDYEVLVIDDGSTDETPEVLATLCEQYPKLRTLRQENAGLAAVRNRGVVETAGQYLIFLDADDRLLPDALERFRVALASLETTPAMVFAGHHSVHPDGKVRVHHARPLTERKKENFRRYIRRKFSISNGAVIMDRRVFEMVRYPEHMRSTEDVPVFGQILALFECASIPEPVLEVHKHDDSMRNDLDAILKVGTGAVDILFDDKIMPSDLMPLRREFLAWQKLSLFRSLYLAGRYSDARVYYRDAVATCPPVLFQLSYLRKYLRALVRKDRNG